ncbi:hypothetical protein ACH492_00175 [Streptomyces sp. NPDC019443]|uniref:hypothetical protein n=1 Tax=Streptomyces sp. NPDC019443 TaxID=3365061 RepID=UPI0037A772CF
MTELSARPVLEPEARAFVNATANRPYLFELVPADGRKAVDPDGADHRFPAARNHRPAHRAAPGPRHHHRSSGGGPPPLALAYAMR